MRWYKYLFRFVGFFWILPVTILFWVFYLLPLLMLNELQWDGWQSFLVVRLRLRDPDMGVGSTYYQRWQNWEGGSGPCVIIYKNFSVVGRYCPERLHKTLVHEERHVDQIFLFGPLYYLIYVGCAVWLWCSGHVFGWNHHHPYWDNPFEQDARRAAGEPMYIDYKTRIRDIWPWW
jgi:hypothetical protein